MKARRCDCVKESHRAHLDITVKLARAETRNPKSEIRNKLEIRIQKLSKSAWPASQERVGQPRLIHKLLKQFVLCGGQASTRLKRGVNETPGFVESAVIAIVLSLMFA